MAASVFSPRSALIICGPLGVSTLRSKGLMPVQVTPWAVSRSCSAARSSVPK